MLLTSPLSICPASLSRYAQSGLVTPVQRQQSWLQPYQVLAECRLAGAGGSGRGGADGVLDLRQPGDQLPNWDVCQPVHPFELTLARDRSGFDALPNLA